ncbi:MAG: hypothetical protein JJT75_01415 [Opitutales bacterium]|nr:hypothetical protein [Opitutales bacterium]MCH8541627.1 hypothetical protein [Opitutales bacterium]
MRLFSLQKLRTLYPLAILSLFAACVHAEDTGEPTPETMKITLELTARTLGYDLEILEVRTTGEKYLALYRLESPPPDAMVGMALDELQASHEFEGSPKPVTHLVLGSERGIYEPPESVRFFADEESMPDSWNEAESLWVKPKDDEAKEE